MFSYRAFKDGRVFVFFQGRHVVTLAGMKADSFLEQVDGADDSEAQLVMARVTGNFKRGNERQAKTKYRR